ncbi:hypothetical protein [Neorhodopirellula pilleata]|nr:hypothetical protein [Neorhodopirellula pilleata]
MMDPFGGGMGGGPFGMGVRPLKVVILLGPDYDFQKPPFINAQEIVRAFGPDENGVLQLGRPTLDTVRVDVSSPIPQSKTRSVAVSHPNDLEGPNLDAFKKRMRLSALRFGINEVEFVPLEPNDREDTARVWLREPYQSEMGLAEQSQTLWSIANSLSMAVEPENPSPAVRLDLFAAPESSGMSQDIDSMEMGGDYGMGMDSGMGMGMTTLESLGQQINTNSKKREALATRMKALVAEIQASPEDNREAMKDQLAEVVRADVMLERSNRELRVEQLEWKLQELKRRLVRQANQTEQTVQERWESLLTTSIPNG